MMYWDIMVTRLIFDSFCSTDDRFIVGSKIIDNKLILSVSNIELNESKDFEVILKEIDVDNQQTASPSDPE